MFHNFFTYNYASNELLKSILKKFLTDSGGSCMH